MQITEIKSYIILIPPKVITVKILIYISLLVFFLNIRKIIFKKNNMHTVFAMFFLNLMFSMSILSGINVSP